MSSLPRLRFVAVIAALLVALGLLASSASATKPPKVMAALGDSITRAFNSDGPGCPTGPFLDCAMNSWSTGTNPAVDSQYQRLEASNPGRDLVAYNDAVSGARAIDLLSQAQAAAAQHADYVTIEIGANDACGSTPTATFRGQVELALKALVGAEPKTYILMLSIPNINQLHTLFTSPPDQDALFRWSALNVCQALLAEPLSMDPADVARRAAFREHVMDLNQALSDVCAQFKRCRFDDNAVFNSSFATTDVATVTNTEGLDDIPFNLLPVFDPGGYPNSTADYFHPSLQGQRELARISWNATFRDFVLRRNGLLSR
jgi:lysophospholipase L1-like esterase